MEGRELQHIFHEHPLLLEAERSKTNGDSDHPAVEITCDGCLIPISGPFYSCTECSYFLHKACAELPSSLDHPLHLEHPLTLIRERDIIDNLPHYTCDFCDNIGSGLFYLCSVCKFILEVRCAFPIYKINDTCHPHPLTPAQVTIDVACHICRAEEKGLFYKCDICPFLVHQNCTTEHSDHDHPYPFRGLQYIYHNHPLILKAERSKTNGGNDHPEPEIKCYGCRIAISGPFYKCEECPYYLHKVCTELPRVLDHPLHPQHPLTCRWYYGPDLKCTLCKETGSEMLVYNCSICSFIVDMKCASATRTIEDKCHPHPLTPIQVPIPFACDICLKTEEGLSYKCNVCPFWVHQNCTLIPDTVEHSDHRHILTLLPSVPFEYSKYCEKCDICHSKLFMFQCNYSCVGCLFFSHVSCARSKTIQSTSRDQYIVLPMKQDSTELISLFVGKYIDGDANIDNTMIHFDHEHPLSLIDEKTNDKTCEACAIQISPPSYGCIDCDYFLHKCCTELPKQIQHPLYPEFQLDLQSGSMFFECFCCDQASNSFLYVSEDFVIDIKCASILQGTVCHEAHKHSLKPIINLSSTCTACGSTKSTYILHCNTCSFELCFMCAMAPGVIKHRYGKSEPFRLTYSAPQNHYDEYICELCLETLNPKLWYYHCVFADQFTHTDCMLECAADSNVKYGKSHMFEEDPEHEHEHKLTTISSTYDCSRCSSCGEPLRSGLAAGVALECKTCNFRVHLRCPYKSFC